MKATDASEFDDASLQGPLMPDHGSTGSMVTLLGTLVVLLLMLCACPSPAGAQGLAVAADLPGALSGLWWNASESGWGIHFAQRRNVLFATLYTYDAAGNPKWYAASSCAMPPETTGTTGTCEGTLYEVSGAMFFGTAFNPAAVDIDTAGSLQVEFRGVNDATLSYTIAGQNRTVALARQQFATGPMPGVDYTDLWWNPSESGWGMAVTQQASVMFLAWYVYDSAGKPFWYVASKCAVSGTGCTGMLYRTTGPPWGSTFDPGLVRTIAAGTVTLAFGDANNGLLTYTVDGVSATKSITRQVFGSATRLESGLYVGESDQGATCAQSSCFVRFYIAPTLDKLAPSPLVLGGCTLAVRTTCTWGGTPRTRTHALCATLPVTSGHWEYHTQSLHITANCAGNTCTGTLSDTFVTEEFFGPRTCSTGDISWTATATGWR